MGADPAALAMLVVLGPRPDLAEAATQTMFWMQLALPLAPPPARPSSRPRGSLGPSLMRWR